jgi:hypothetical protein
MSKYYRSVFDGRNINQKDYLAEFDLITKSLEEKHGLICIGFDPGVTVSHKKFKGTSMFYPCAFNMPMWYVKQLLGMED